MTCKFDLVCYKMQHMCEIIISNHHTMKKNSVHLQAVLWLDDAFKKARKCINCQFNFAVAWKNMIFLSEQIDRIG